MDENGEKDAEVEQYLKTARKKRRETLAAQFEAALLQNPAIQTQYIPGSPIESFK